MELHKEDKPVVVEAIQALKDGESIRRNYGRKTKDGKSVWKHRSMKRLQILIMRESF